jgi:hypothetical protein
MEKITAAAGQLKKLNRDAAASYTDLRFAIATASMAGATRQDICQASGLTFSDESISGMVRAVRGK